MFHQHVVLAVKLCSVYGQHQPLSSMARASTQQEVKMASKKIGRGWVAWGRVPGFSLGICINKYFITVDLVFWYVSVEF